MNENTVKLATELTTPPPHRHGKKEEDLEVEIRQLKSENQKLRSQITKLKARI